MGQHKLSKIFRMELPAIRMSVTFVKSRKSHPVQNGETTNEPIDPEAAFNTAFKGDREYVHLFNIANPLVASLTLCLRQSIELVDRDRRNGLFKMKS